MKNRLLAVALCICMTGALMGCGGQPAASSGESTGESPETGTGEVSEPPAEPTEKPAPEPVVREGDYTVSINL